MNNKLTEQMTWRGKDVNDMTKAELIQALKAMSNLQDQSSKQHLHELKVMSGLK